MTTSPDQETATSGAVPTLRDRARWRRLDGPAEKSTGSR